MSFVETRKDIFKYNSQAQLELPELVAKTALNKIEFRPNDGIYVNGVRLASGGATPVGNSTIADCTPPVAPPLIVSTPVPFGRTTLEFNTLNYGFQYLQNVSIEIPYTENPSRPFSTINFISPIIRYKNGKATNQRGIDFQVTYIFDPTAGTFVMTIEFGLAYGAAGLLAGYTLDIDFLIA